MCDTSQAIDPIAASSGIIVDTFRYVCVSLCSCSFVRLHSVVRACSSLCVSCIIVIYAHRCDDYETSATLLVNAAIALSVTTIVLMKDDCNM